ncbi:MAG: glycosyltransferase family 39 protein [Crocinitomicaceae bacterium]|nr:glycosyltransferase family 39 protein [Crocinitomicaceae bacterium]
MPRFQNLLKLHLPFFLLFIGTAWFYGQFESINEGPFSRHQWRQADCLSITNHYYEQDLPFLEPEIYWQGDEGDGKTISEFPLLYYVVGNVWKVTGKQYWIYRLISFSILLFGIFYLKKAANQLLNNQFWSTFVAIFFFTSPLLGYYGNNFLINTNALGLALIGSYHAYIFLKKRSQKPLLYSCVFFLFAGLFKLTALLLFFGFGAIFLWQVIIEKSWKTRWKHFLPYLSTLLLFVIWFKYVDYYNSKHLSQIFLQGTMPIWEMSWENIQNNWSSLIYSLTPEFFNPYILVGLFVFFIFISFKQKGRNTGIFALTSIILFGVILYLILFFQVFDVHDYYLINLTIIVPLILLSCLFFLKNTNQKVFTHIGSKIIGSALLGLLIYSTAIQTRIKYRVDQNWVINSPIIDNETRDFWTWYHWNYAKTKAELTNIEPYLSSIGITKEDKVISLSDKSINISLYLMNRKGYTSFWMMKNKKIEEITDLTKRMELWISWGAHYLIIYDESQLKEEYLQPYLSNEIGRRNNVRIYQIAS